MISTNPIFSYLVIFGSIMGCLLVSYILLPSINAIIAGTLEISLASVIMIPTMVYILAALFIVVNLILLLRRIRKVIDKEKAEILIYRGKKFESKTTLQIPISNFENSEIELAGYYQLTIPLKGKIGELESFHNWIRQEKLILIQSGDERFINDLQENILMFLETA